MNQSTGRTRGPRRGHGSEQLWIRQGERRGRPETTAVEREEIRSWFIGNLIDGWFVGEPGLTIDDYEILVVGELPDFDTPDDPTVRAGAETARIERFREDSRERRIEIARRAEERFARTVSWGATAGATTHLFTTASVPVMTRLRLDHRRTLDVLVEAGVARSRSEALAWCVELVGEHEREWIDQLREALDTVQSARRSGPSSRTQ